MAQLSVVGPINPANGFPYWYRDAANTQLDLCLTNPTLCALLAPVQLVNPGQPFPLDYAGTFPDEAPYWSVNATVPTNGGGQGLLVLSLTGAFVNGVVIPGDQMVFARLRLRIDNLVAGATYRITTPFSVVNQVAASTGKRGINFTQDIGLTAGAFGLALNGGIGPFLRWNAGLPILDPLGNSYLGDPTIPHAITGSPTGNNFFRIDGQNVGGPGVNTVSTTLFTLAGKLTSFPPPVASFTAVPVSGSAPLTVAFTDTSIGTVGARAWDFGDASTSLAANPSHVYSAPGSYTVTLVVSGAGGNSTVVRPNLITVTAPAPVAHFTATPRTGTAPLSVAFTNTSTGTFTTQSWNFGDGSVSTLANPTHVYAASGLFTVALTVTGPGGSNTATSAGFITVAAAPGGAAPIADFSATPLSGNAPLAVAFTNLSTGTVTSQRWTFGDGAVSTLASPTHTYTAGGSFTVSLTATNASGSNTKTVVGMITVAGAPPPPAGFTLTAGTPGTAPGPNTFTATGGTSGSETVLLWSPATGSTNVSTFHGCNLNSGLSAPVVLGTTTSTTTATWRINIGTAMVGRTILLRAVDSRACRASNIVTQTF
jgi:PKD repeat protein